MVHVFNSLFCFRSDDSSVYFLFGQMFVWPIVFQPFFRRPSSARRPSAFLLSIGLQSVSREYRQCSVFWTITGHKYYIKNHLYFGVYYAYIVSSFVLLLKTERVFHILFTCRNNICNTPNGNINFHDVRKKFFYILTLHFLL